MTEGRTSLRALIDKWVGRTATSPIRVIRHGDARSRRYVHVSLLRSQSAHMIFFFRHDDGSRNVFPPETQRPAMT
ncbi:hypothetical protein FVF58_45375 [Paraburkholderia panacisoli]|jgi:hypothetical protein|uniref:Uncharacterized protein n=1 Tax=Paraburkholderia panacisoli TaxID=2603818 RepID=A0A5B0G4B6_9BURK|nr:hypothetical protein [Paraburkholderia panacisoli]KAA0998226.1 hypothetical protein FVF58_45375 [Paraburkholderia panacisoli]